MSDHKDCDCRACRAGRAAARLTVANADFAASTARFNAINARRVSSEAEADLWISISDRLARSMGSCAAAMNAAMDQFEAAKGRCD